MVLKMRPGRAVQAARLRAGRPPPPGLGEFYRGLTRAYHPRMPMHGDSNSDSKPERPAETLVDAHRGNY